jgi:hypothetical protein
VTTINAATLRTMLQQVAPHMGEDDSLPVLNAVHLEARDGYLFAAASDRYTIAVARNTLLGPDQTWRAMIPAGDLATITAWLKSADDNIELTVTENPPISDLTLTCQGSVLKTTASIGNGFPQWRTIMRSALAADPEPVPLSTWTTKYLTRWKHADKTLHAWQAGPNKPLVFADRAGSFLGMQMPVRDEAERSVLVDRWLRCLTAIAYVDHQSYRLDVQWADKDGDPWEYSGQDRYGEPLMQVVGIEDDRHTLARVIELYGPIRPLAADDV